MLLLSSMGHMLHPPLLSTTLVVVQVIAGCCLCHTAVQSWIALWTGRTASIKAP